MTIYEKYSNKLKSMLELRGTPVAVIYTDIPAEDATEGKYQACYAWIEASKGKVIDLNCETSLCPGGTWHLGLGPSPKGEGWKRLKNFLVNGEKLCATQGAFWRMIENCTSPPLGLAEHVIYRPLETCTADPELVMFIVTPKQACRLAQLLQFDDGLPLRPEMGGASCHQVIGYPLVSGQPTVALGDWTNRSPDKFAYDELFVTVPWHRMHNMMAAIPRCTAGEAKIERSPGFDLLED